MQESIKQAWGIFGTSSAEEFEQAFKLKMNYHKYNYYSKSLTEFIVINFVDKMHTSYGRQSDIIFKADSNGILSKECLDDIKKAVKRKIAQIRVFENIKAEGIIKIKQFVSDTFGIDPELIETKDIIFDNYNRYSIAGISFSYGGTITDKSFTLSISPYSYRSYKEITNEIDSLRAYFNNKKNSEN